MDQKVPTGRNSMYGIFLVHSVDNHENHPKQGFGSLRGIGSGISTFLRNNCRK